MGVYSCRMTNMNSHKTVVDQPLQHMNLSDITAASKTRLRLFAGFSALLLLFILPIAIGLNLLRRAEKNISTIVNEHNVKMELVSSMVNAARMRSLLLYQMINTRDAFDRDELFQSIQSYGANFAIARAQMLAMKLTAKELKFMKQQGRLSGIAVPLQRQIIDMTIEDHLGAAIQLLITQAVPAQNNVMEVLGKLQDLQHKAARNIARKNQQQLQDAYYIILTLASLALITGVIIAVYVTRHSTRTEQHLFLEKELAQVTLHSIADAIITTDQKGNIKHINPNAEKLTGWPRSKAQGQEIGHVFNVSNSKNNNYGPNPITATLTHGKIAINESESTLLNSSGDEYAIEYSSAPIIDQNNNIHGAVIIFRDVTEIRTLTHQLSYQASHDSLTGLINRREFERRLDQALNNARAEHQLHVLLYLDLDLFKIINDTCGHAAGDELLKQLSAKLRDVLRESDVLARLGGDEFGVLLESCPVNKATQIAESLRETVHDTRFIWDDKSFEIGVSIGLVPIIATSGTLSDILSEADTACYEAKDQGRNRIHIYYPDDSKLQKRRGEMHWVHRINDALDKNQFLLYCHNIHAINSKHHGSHNSGNPRQVEILLRLQGEDGRIIPPMAFIPAAERYNLMPVIDKYVITKTFEYINLHPDEKQLRFFINLSGQSLCDIDFMAFISNEFKVNNIQPERFTFEITETAAIANFTRAVTFINTLKTQGCQFALDDFGSGLSSFAYLKNLPVNYIKIDGTFVRGIVNDTTDAAFIEAIYQIGSIMGIDTIAEYVENEQILDKIRSIGITYAQGFHLDKPRPLQDIFLENIKNVSA